MVISLVGSNSFGLQNRLDELVAKFIERQNELALERFDAEETEAQKIADAISNLPFFG